MKHAESKMMDSIAEIENYVLGGLVLDDRGKWVSIADKKASEEDFLAHLEAGRVLHNGQWVKFTDAKTLPGPELPASFTPVVPEEETSLHALPGAVQNDSYPPETVVVTIAPAAVRLSKASGADEAAMGQYPPETKAMDIQSSANNAADVSSYAMETGLFVIDRSSNAPQAFQSETKPTMAVQPAEAPLERKTKSMPLVPPSIPTWEKEETQQKKRTLVIGGIIVAAIGIGAIAVILMQVLH
jgi:hypothetical protein